MDTVKSLVDDVRASLAADSTSQVKDQPTVRDAPRAGQPVKDAPAVRRSVC